MVFASTTAPAPNLEVRSTSVSAREAAILREAATIRRISQQRRQVNALQVEHAQRAMAFRRQQSEGQVPDPGPDRLDEWRAASAALSASHLSLEQDTDLLRRSDRRAWRADEEAALNEVLDADRAWHRDLLANRAEERAARQAERHERPDLQVVLNRRECSFKLDRRKERRARREEEEGPRPWASTRPSTAPQRPQSASERPSTAPARSSSGLQGQLPTRRGPSLMVCGHAPPLSYSRVRGPSAPPARPMPPRPVHVADRCHDTFLTAVGAAMPMHHMPRARAAWA